MGLADTARLAVQLDLKGNFSGQLRANQRALGSFDAAVTRSGTRAYRAGQQIGTGFLRAARIIATGATVAAGGLVGVLKVAGDFESQLNTINTIAHKNADELGAIGEAIRKVARDTGTGLEDLTQGYYDLLSAGIKAADAQNVLTAANTLAIGGLSTTAESIDLLTTAINTYGGDAKQAAADADIFAKAIERGKVTAAELAQSFAQVGPIAAASGISIAELSAGYARLTAAGVPAAEAATQMRSAIVSLTKVTGPLEKLQKQTGRNYLAIAGKKGLVEALEIMRKDAAKAGVPLIDLLGRVEGLNFTLATTGPNFAAYNADLEAMGEATGTAAAQMAERQKGLNYQLTILKAKVKDAAIVIGSELLPRITPVFERLNKALADPKVISQIQAFGEKLAGLFTDKNIDEGVRALKGAFEIARDAAPVVAEAARITGAALKVAVDLFRSLPPEIQGLAVAGLAINKITGGLVTNIAGGLISSVLKQLVSGVVNVQGAVVNVGGAAGLGGVAGGGGKLGAVVGIVQKVAIVSIAAEAASLIAGPIQDFGKDIHTGIFGSGGDPFSDFGRAWTDWRRNADWPFGQKNAPEWAGGRGPAPADIPIGAVAAAAALAAKKLNEGGLSPEDRQNLSDRRTTLGGERDIAEFVTVAKTTNSSLSRGFASMVRELQRAKGSKDIAAAVKNAIKVTIEQGRGNVVATTRVLAGLKSQLKNTHDPKLQAILRAAIAKVEGKLPGRAFAARELAKADQILRSNRTSAQKIEDLKRIERALKDHGLPQAASRIRSKIDEAKRAQVTAANRTSQAVKDKKLHTSVTIPITNNVAVSGRDIVRNQTTFRLLGGTIRS